MWRLKKTFSTEALCLAEVQKNGMALRHVPEKLKTEAVYLAAVKQDRNAIEYVPQALRTEAFCINAGIRSAISSGSGGSGYGVGLINIQMRIGESREWRMGIRD